jgi:hypothetical protein
LEVERYLRQIECGKPLDVSDDGFGPIAAVEQDFIGEREWQGFHIFAHPGHQRQPTPKQSRREFLAKIALVTKELARQAREFRHSHASWTLPGVAFSTTISFS